MSAPRGGGQAPARSVRRFQLPRWAKDLLWRFGYEAVPLDPRLHPLSRRVRLLEHHGIDLVLDVGANAGQYGRELRRGGYAGRIVSFEPLAAAFAALRAAAASDPAWEVVRTALGERAGTATINVSANSYSSSFLEILPAHVASAPDAAYVGREEVPMQTLAAALQRHAAGAARPYLKLDVQGYERRILESGAAALGGVEGIQLELSLVALYGGEATFRQLLDLLERSGFALMSLEPGHTDPASGRLLQVDGVFFRER